MNFIFSSLPFTIPTASFLPSKDFLTYEGWLKTYSISNGEIPL